MQARTLGRPAIARPALAVRLVAVAALALGAPSTPITAVAAAPARAKVATERAACEREFVPEYAQSGKDVIWIPTPDALVERMLKMARVGADDLVVDLGAGDGKIAIAAARDFGARARGIEYDARMVRLAQCYANAEGVGERVTMLQGDIFALDFRDATVVTMYLLPDLVLRLRPRLLQMQPGTRIVSNAYHLGDWGADDTVRIPAGVAYLWIVPAQAGGQWRVTAEDGSVYAVSIGQAYQRVAAQVLAPGAADAFAAEGRLRGTALELSAGRERWQLDATVDGPRLTGTLRTRSGTQPVRGERVTGR